MRIAKWGNSLAVRLPAAVVETLALEPGDEVEIRITPDRVFDIARKPNRAELLNRLYAHRGALPQGYRFDRDEAHER